MIRNVLITIALLAIFGCNSATDDPAASSTSGLGFKCESRSNSLVGCWHSEDCVASSVLPGKYIGGALDFRNDGSVAQATALYSTSNCSGRAEVSGIPQVQYFTVLNSVITTQGETANFLQIDSSLGTSNGTAYTAYFIEPQTGRLCFPADDFGIAVSVAYFAPGYSTINPVPTVTIDTSPNACLIK